MNIPVLHVCETSLAAAYEKALITLYENGVRFQTQYDKAGDPQSLDCTMNLTVLDPFSEPMIHKAFPGGIEDPIQVKQKDKVGRPDVDAFEAMMMREGCDIGFFVSFAYSSDALTEIGAFFKRTGKMIRALTVKDILDEEIARKIA